MTDKELKRLSRAEMLSMMLNLSKENEELRQRLEKAEHQLANRAIAIRESGSLAEAALRLNGIFVAAQAACEQYTENITKRSERIDKYCAEMERQTQEKCKKMLADAQKRVDAYLIEEAMKVQGKTAEEKSAVGSNSGYRAPGFTKQNTESKE